MAHRAAGALALLVVLAASGAVAQPGPPPASPSPVVATPACLERLRSAGAQIEPVTVDAAANPACAVAEPVRLSGLALSAGRSIAFPDRPILACAFAASVVAFTRDLIDPLAVGQLGAPVAAIATGPGYECRSRNRQPGARLSAHATGIAIDVGSVLLVGGRRLLVGEPRDDGEKRFFESVRAAACGWFTTVVGPGSDAAHGSHFHFDALVRGQSGRGRWCE